MPALDKARSLMSHSYAWLVRCDDPLSYLHLLELLPSVEDQTTQQWWLWYFWHCYMSVWAICACYSPAKPLSLVWCIDWLNKNEVWCITAQWVNGWTWLQYCESRLPITSRLWLSYFCAKTCTVNNVKHHITLQSLGNDGCHPPANSTLEAASAKDLLSPCPDLPQIHPTDSVFPRSPGHFQHRSATGSCKYLMVGKKTTHCQWVASGYEWLTIVCNVPWLQVYKYHLVDSNKVALVLNKGFRWFQHVSAQSSWHTTILPNLTRQ